MSETDLYELEAAPVVDKPAQLNTSPQLLADVFDRITRKDGAALSGSPLFHFRTQEVEIVGADCSPGVFVDCDGEYFNFTLTLRALSSQEELTAMRGLKEPMHLPGRLAKQSMHMLNGQKIPEKQLDFVWEALGSCGRQIVSMTFAQIGAASEASLGKFQDAFSTK